MDRLLSLPKTVSVRSPAFAEGAAIPSKHTCKGENVSPPLAWGGLPAGAGYLAVVMDDPDAPRGTFTHWTFWDLPARVAEIAPGADVTDLGAVEGRNDFGDVGYGGPCPPSGTHRYFVKVFALREPLGLPRGAAVREVADALAGRSLAWGATVGTFTK